MQWESKLLGDLRGPLIDSQETNLLYNLVTIRWGPSLTEFQRFPSISVAGCPLWLEKLKMLEKLENEPFFRIWLEKLENHRFFPCFGWKYWNSFLSLVIMKNILR